MEERLKQVQQKALVQQDVVHKQEVSALTQEWNTERKVKYIREPCGCCINLLLPIDDSWTKLFSQQNFDSLIEIMFFQPFPPKIPNISC